MKIGVGFGGVRDGDILVQTYACSNTLSLRLKNHQNITDLMKRKELASSDFDIISSLQLFFKSE